LKKMRKNIPHIVKYGQWWKSWESKFISRSHQEYKHSPLFLLPPTKMGTVCNQIAQGAYERDGRITSPPCKSSMYTNKEYEYDFHDVTNNLRVEVKSSSLIYFKHRGKDAWKFLFQHVKPNLFDKLILVGHFPDGVNVWEWDEQTGLTKMGKTTESLGYNIALYQYGGELPLRSIFRSNFGELLLSLSFSEVNHHFPNLLHTNMEYDFYQKTPFSKINRCSRGLLLEDMVKSIWRENLGNISTPKEFTSGKIGSYDFHDDLYQRRVEVKSASVRRLQNNGVQRWRIQFQCLKTDNFDDLVLVAYFPDRIEMYLWDGESYLGSSGRTASTQGCGLDLVVHMIDGKFFFPKEFGLKFFTGYFDN